MSTYPNAGSSSRITPETIENAYQEETGDDDEAESEFLRNMSFEEALEEVMAKFMANVPQAETVPVRLYFLAEQAHWYYDDFLRAINPSLPSLSQKHFTKLLISSSPLYANMVDEQGRPIDYSLVWDEYIKYRKMVPTCGVILVNAKESKALVVRHFNSKAWSWPKGKINEHEEEVDCAIRELEEETGYDCSQEIDSNAKCSVFIGGQKSTMFFVTGVDESFPFAAQTRNEIETRWVRLQDLPTWSKKRAKQTEKSIAFWKVAPFIHALKQFLHDPNRGGRTRANILQAAVRDDAAVPSAVPIRSVASGSSNPHTQPVAAFNKLFANYEKEQEADLQRSQTTPTQNNDDPIAKLFAKISVASASEQARKEEKEDDALTRLLGGAIGTSATPAPSQQHQQLEPARSNLLSILNEKKSDAPPPPPQPASPQHHDSPTPKPHAASLLAMLASPPQVAAKSPLTAPPPIHHVSLPTTPRPPSPPVDDRVTKQRALLEMTLAGLSLDTSSARQSTQVQQLYNSIEYGNQAQAGAYHEPPRNTPPQPPTQQQYRPPAPPATFAPPSGAYYTSNPSHITQSHHPGSSYPNGPGPSPPRNRGAPPPPYESHYGAPGPVRPMPPVIPAAPPVHGYNSHAQGYYARPQPPIPTQGQSYRPHLPQQPQPQPQPPQQQQQPYAAGFQQPYVSPQNSYQPSYGGPAGYQAPTHRPPVHQGSSQYQPQHPQLQQQQPYIPSVQGHNPNNGIQSHHTGPMHQPIPKSGPGSNLLAMLNNR